MAKQSKSDKEKQKQLDNFLKHLAGVKKNGWRLKSDGAIRCTKNRCPIVAVWADFKFQEISKKLNGLKDVKSADDLWELLTINGLMEDLEYINANETDQGGPAQEIGVMEAELVIVKGADNSSKSLQRDSEDDNPEEAAVAKEALAYRQKMLKVLGLVEKKNHAPRQGA